MLAVSLTLEAGPLAYDKHIVALRLRRARLPALDRLVALLPHGVAVEAEPGDPIALELDGGEGAEAVFAGTLDRLTRTDRGVRLEAVNGGAALAAYRPTASLQALSVGDAIRRLAGDVEVDVEVDDDGPGLALLAMDGRETAAQRIADLARLTGQGCAFDGEGRLQVSAAGGIDDRIALRFGREILAAEATQAAEAGATLSVVGEGADDPDAPRGRLPATNFDAGAAGDAGPANRRIGLADARTSDAARLASGALGLERDRLRQRARLTTFLLPAIAPGMAIELSDMPDYLPLAEMRVMQVVHNIRPDVGAVTEITGTGVAGTDPLAALGELLGSLAGALL